MRFFRPAFALLAISFGLAAGFHAVTLARPSLGADVPAWRHGLFVAINLACAAGFLRRTRVFIFAFALLSVQQLHSHGLDAWHAWRDEARIDVASVAVLLVMPFALVLLVADAYRARRARASTV